MMRQILFIINPNAGQKTVEEFEQAMAAELAKLPPGEQAIKIETFIPNSPDEMRDTLREKFLKNPVDIVGVVGGDGTIMETLPILVEFPSIKLALIPYGTGNLLAANLGIPRDFSTSLDTLFNGKARRIDVATINEHYFALIAGVGVVADIMENTPREHKKRFGIWAYLANGIKTIFQAERSRFKITTENRTFTAKGVAVIISNAASFLGPCLPLTPNAEPDDGLLDVCIVKSRSNRDYFPTVLEVLLNQNANRIMTKHIISFRTRRLHIASSRKLKVQADGNVIGTTPVDIEIIRNRLQIMVPLTEFDRPADHRRQTSESSLLETLKCYLTTATSEAGSGIK
jgi:diacylglycerol kinase (ATP)